MRAGTTRVVATSGATADAAGFEALRNRTVVCGRAACPPAAGFDLMSVAFVDADGSAGVVVANANAAPAAFTLRDTRGARATDCTIPAHSIQTYTW
jgi:hypothetical protein